MAETVQVSMDHYEELAEYMADFSHDSRRSEFWMRRFASWWDENPVFSQDPVRGWMIQDEGRIGGFLGNIVSPMSVSGRPLLVHSMTSWRVLPEYRAMSMALVMQSINAARHTLLFNATPTPDVSRIMESLGFSVLPGHERKGSVIPLQYGATMDSLLKSRFSIPALRKAAGLVISALQWGRGGFKSGNGGFSCRLLGEAGPEFDRLWERSAAHTPTTNQRSADYLNWHCFSLPEFKKDLIACYQSDALDSYTVWSLDRRDGLAAYTLLDAWPEPAEPQAHAAMLELARGRAMELGCAFLLLPHYSQGLARFCRRASLLHIGSVEIKRYCRTGPELEAPPDWNQSYLNGMTGEMGL